MPDPQRSFTAEQIATATTCPIAAVREHWPRLVEQLGHCGIAERSVQLAMIGTVAIETASRFAPIHEFRNADGSIPAGWHNYDGGAAYHGRGFIQITHRSNYARYGPKVAELWGTSPDQPDFDLVGDPDRALQPDVSAAIAALYFRDHGGTNLELIPKAARRGNWAEVRRLVWGANPLDFPVGNPGRDAYERMVGIIKALDAPAEPQEPTGPRLRVNANGVRLRSGPGTEFDILDNLPIGATVEPVTDHAWRQVRHEGQEGWMAATYLDEV